MLKVRNYDEKLLYDLDVSSDYIYNQVIQVNLNNFSFIGNDKIIDIFVIRNKLIFIQIYIPNLRIKWYNEGTDNLEEWEKYVLGLVETNIESSKELGGEINIMKEYVDEAKEVIKDTGFGESYDKEWALQDQARRDGIEEGIKQGIEQKNLEIVHKMKEKGISLEDISEITGLTIEEIEGIKKAV